MTKTVRDMEVTERLRAWLEEEYGNRGRFRALEEASGLPAQRWKNVFYGRQAATNEMLEFVQKTSTDGYSFVITGMRRPLSEGYPFRAAPPRDRDVETLADRLVWAIKEFASPRGDALFSYLEERSQGEVSAKSWADLVLGLAPPTLPMIDVVLDVQPHLTEWVMRGAVVAPMQVDPTDKDSVEAWANVRKRLFARLEGSVEEEDESP